MQDQLLRFEEMEGKVTYYGKPYPEIYKDCIQDEKKSAGNRRQFKYRYKRCK